MDNQELIKLLMGPAKPKSNDNERAIQISDLVEIYRDLLGRKSQEVDFGEKKVKKESPEDRALVAARYAIKEVYDALDTIAPLQKSVALPEIKRIVFLIDLISRHLGFISGIHGNKFATARRNAQKKHSSPKNEKAKAKEFVKTCWVEWEKQKDKYPSKEAFARDMLEKCEHLKSTKVITRWCKDWEEQAKMEPC